MKERRKEREDVQFSKKENSVLCLKRMFGWRIEQNENRNEGRIESQVDSTNLLQSGHLHDEHHHRLLFHPGKEFEKRSKGGFEEKNRKFKLQQDCLMQRVVTRHLDDSSLIQLEWKSDDGTYILTHRCREAAVS